ncbi:isochorismatase family protein [Haliangium sp.]|uniref:isochorismatase family protein n=1 Tax=Haliangium sp. TaxID=2663208 RepID=UPI003D0F09A8
MSTARSVLLIVDIQERLAAAMPTEPLAQLTRNAVLLVQAARHLGVPVVVSQQYPKGLGSTLDAVEAALADQVAHRFDKTVFSACAAPEFATIRTALGRGRDQWIVCGMETHVCVLQTVRDLVEIGQTVQVPRDAVSSRVKSNWRIGLSLCERAGAVVSSTEAVVFDLLGRAGTDAFKALSKLIK